MYVEREKYDQPMSNTFSRVYTTLFTFYLFNNIGYTECGVPPEGIFNFQFSLRITDCLYYCVVYQKLST